MERNKREKVCILYGKFQPERREGKLEITEIFRRFFFLYFEKIWRVMTSKIFWRLFNGPLIYKLYYNVYLVRNHRYASRLFLYILKNQLKESKKCLYWLLKFNVKPPLSYIKDYIILKSKSVWVAMGNFKFCFLWEYKHEHKRIV